MKKLVNFSRQAILLLAIVIFAVLWLASLLLENRVDIYEQSLLSWHSPVFIVWLLLLAVLIGLLIRLTMKIDDRLLCAILAFMWFCAGAYLILHQNDMLRFDARYVYETAQQFNQGDFKHAFAFPGYINEYPHQLGLVSFERMVIGLTGSIQSLFWLNLVMAIADNVILYRLLKQMTNDGLWIRSYLILSFIFLPHLFFILFIYGLTYSLFFIVLAAYELYRYVEKRRWYDMIGVAVSLAIAVLLRNNAIIAVLAVLIFLAIDLLKNKQVKTIAMILLTMVTLVGAGHAMDAYYRQETGMVKPTGIPKVAWIAMGLGAGGERHRAYGWYNSYNHETYKADKGDDKKIEDDSLFDIKDRLTYFRQHPMDTLRFFKGKFLTTWLDGTFQSIWSGPILRSKKQEVYGSVMDSIYHYGRLNQWIEQVSAVLLSFYYGTILVGISSFWKRRGQNLFVLLPLLYFLGGLAFHLIWETKSQYVYPYIYLLLPLSALGLRDILSWLQSAEYPWKRLFKKNKNA